MPSVPCIRQLAKINDEIVEVLSVSDGSHTCLPVIDVPGADYYIAQTSEEAGEAASDRWREMAEDDPKEFTCLIGEERLVGWALGQSDSFGIGSLDDFLETVGDQPEEEWASYDGHEVEAFVNVHVAEEIGWDTAGATFDESTLRSALADGEHEGCIPDEHAEKTPDEILSLALACEDTEEWAADLLNSYRFVECVAYRHN